MKRTEGDVDATPIRGYGPIVEILGGARVLTQTPLDPLGVHDLLLHGLPGAALTHLMGGSGLLSDPASLEKAVGVSVRTMQRRRGSPAKPLSQELSGRAWKFAEILAMAIAVFGSRPDAERWLDSPALGLDGRRPLDLLATTAGVAIVEDHLVRLEYGVYT